MYYYGDDSFYFQSSTGNLGDFAQFKGYSGGAMCQGGDPNAGEFQLPSICMNLVAVLV